MSPILALILFLAIATALPPINYRDIEVVSQEDRRDHLGQFAYRYLFEDGTEITEQGALKRTPDGKDNVLVKKGSYRYMSPEGQEVRVDYIADETGYHAISSSIPQPVQATVR
nr:larval cuticle protein 1-like [Halyomorpha halys]